MSKTRKCLDICQYYQYALWPEVSSPPGSGFSAMAQPHTQTTHGHCDLETESAQLADSVKTYCRFENSLSTMHVNHVNQRFVEKSILIGNQVPLWESAHFLWAIKVCLYHAILDSLLKVKGDLLFAGCI